MSHPRVELLSTYLDERLEESDRRGLESHLEECSECHQRLQGMRRVMQRLESLDRQAPLVHHRVASGVQDGRDRGLHIGVAIVR